MNQRNEENKEVQEEGSGKKLLFILGLFLIVLITAYFLFFQHQEIIKSLLLSKEAENQEISFKEKKFVFSEEIVSQLEKIFLENQKHEFKVCLLGKKENNTYYLDKLIAPKIYWQTVFNLISESCPAQSLVSLHSHPRFRCLPSEQDLKSLKEEQKENPGLVGAIICDKRRFYFYW